MPGRDPKGPLIMAATAIYTQSLVEGLLAGVGKSERLSHLMPGRDVKDPLIMAVKALLKLRTRVFKCTRLNQGWKKKPALLTRINAGIRIYGHYDLSLFILYLDPTFSHWLFRP